MATDLLETKLTFRALSDEDEEDDAKVDDDTDEDKDADSEDEDDELTEDENPAVDTGEEEPE
jgi:hypothetical protein